MKRMRWVAGLYSSLSWTVIRLSMCLQWPIILSKHGPLLQTHNFESQRPHLISHKYLITLLTIEFYYN